MLTQSDERCIQKLRTLLCYFQRITTQMPNGVVSFERFSQETPAPCFSSSTDTMQPVVITGTGLIEREGEEYVQVDFANRRIGGHALAKGLVQEEIRFMICPELIVSILLADAMEKDDCIVITGAEMYSNYTGYGSTYKFTGAKTDELPRDELMRKMTQIVAMDALYY